MFSSVSSALIIGFLISLKSIVGYSDGRIVASDTPGTRCLGRAIKPDKCEKKRKKALDRGCITKEEYNALIKYNSTPTCDYEEEQGLNQLQSWCPCGCVQGDVEISVFDKEQYSDLKIPSQDLAYNREDFLVKTLHTEGNNSNGNDRYKKIELSTVGQAQKKLVRVELTDDRKIELTQNHPVVLKSMKLKHAKDLKKGDFLLDEHNKNSIVRSVSLFDHVGSVYNFATEEDTSNPLGHIIFGNGIAIGDLTLEATMRNFNASRDMRK